MRSLYESLLDDADIIANHTDDAIYDAILHDEDSAFVKTIYPKDSQLYKKHVYDDKSSSYADGVLRLCTNNFIPVWASRYGGSRGSIILADFFPGIKELDVPGCIRTEIGEFSSRTMAKTINAKAVIIHEVSTIKDVTINLYTASRNIGGETGDRAWNNIGVGTVSKFIVGPNAWAKPSAAFDNVEVNFIDHIDENKKLIFAGESIPNISGLKSNATNIYQHDTFLFDDEEKVQALSNMFDYTYAPTILDTKKNQLVKRPIKNFKTLTATINNPKRYAVQDELIYKLKSTAKVKDVYDFRGCKNLDFIDMHNNNIRIVMTRSTDRLRQCFRWANKPSSFEWRDIPQTADGWWVMVGKYV